MIARVTQEVTTSFNDPCWLLSWSPRSVVALPRQLSRSVMVVTLPRQLSVVHLPCVGFKPCPRSCFILFHCHVSTISVAQCNTTSATSVAHYHADPLTHTGGFYVCRLMLVIQSEGAIHVHDHYLWLPCTSVWHHLWEYSNDVSLMGMSHRYLQYLAWTYTHHKHLIILEHGVFIHLWI